MSKGIYVSWVYLLNESVNKIYFPNSDKHKQDIAELFNSRYSKKGCNFCDQNFIKKSNTNAKWCLWFTKYAKDFDNVRHKELFELRLKPDRFAQVYTKTKMNSMMGREVITQVRESRKRNIDYCFINPRVIWCGCIYLIIKHFLNWNVRVKRYASDVAKFMPHSLNEYSEYQLFRYPDIIFQLAFHLLNSSHFASFIMLAIVDIFIGF